MILKLGGNVAAVAGACALSACVALYAISDLGAPPIPEVAGVLTLTERYLTERDPNDNVDSPTIWHGPDDQHWLIVSAKQTDRLLVYDASNGELIRKYGQSGNKPGEFERPNGVFVVDDLLLVVERDNRRVQVLALPDLKPVMQFGSHGDQALIKPYGLWAQSLGKDGIRVFVTDNYETAQETVPAASQLGARVHQFLLSRDGNRWTAARERRFGATSGDGVLNIVESIWGDAPAGILMIADEEEFNHRDIKVYRMDGQYAGMRMGAGLFRYQPEGITLYQCDDTSGWWIAADQGKQDNFFHVFDRASLRYVGSFAGTTTLNTDGIWLTQKAFPGFPEGAFFAVHDDGNVAAFDLRTIRRGLALKDCS